MADLRDCAQCGAAFEPGHEDAWFCSAACRMIVSRSSARGQLTGDTTLSWSIGAMNDTVQRLGKAAGIDLPDALALVSEAVWWVILVDAAMVRYHQTAYEQSLASLSPADRKVAEGTLIGLRFVRNWMGDYADPADFVQPELDPGGGDAPVAAWTWNSLPETDLGTVSPRGRDWRTARHRHYCAHLAHKPIGATIARAAAFLNSITLAPPAAGELGERAGAGR